MGRPVALWAALAILLQPSSAVAAEAVVVFHGSASSNWEVRDRVLEMIRQEGYSRVDWAAPDDVERELQIVGLSTREEDETCGRVIPLAAWLEALEKAEEEIQLLALDAAAARLARLHRDRACVDGVPARRDLQRVGTERARAEVLAGQISDSEARLELARTRAAEAVEDFLVLGDDLSLPEGLDPEIRTLIADRTQRASVRVYGAGPRGRVAVDGQRLTRSPVQREAGLHLLQVEDPETSEVVAAGLHVLDRGRVLVWAGSYERGQLARELRLVSQGREGDSDLLAAAMAALGKEVLVVEQRGRGLRVYRVDGTLLGTSTLENPDAQEPGTRTAPRARPPGGGWQFALGGGLATGLGAFVEPPSLSGATAGPTLWVRQAFSPLWSASLIFHPQLRSEPLLSSHESEANWGWRMFQPVRAGVRTGSHEYRTAAEIGADLWVIGLGESASRSRVRWGGGLSLGLYHPAWSLLGLRSDLYGGGGPGWWALGASVGLEHGW